MAVIPILIARAGVFVIVGSCKDGGVCEKEVPETKNRPSPLETKDRTMKRKIGDNVAPRSHFRPLCSSRGQETKEVAHLHEFNIFKSFLIVLFNGMISSPAFPMGLSLARRSYPSMLGSIDTFPRWKGKNDIVF